MKRKIYLILLPLLGLSVSAFAQPDENTIVSYISGGGATFRLDNDEGDITLYNVNNRFTYAEWGHKDGTPIPYEVQRGIVKTLKLDGVFDSVRYIVDSNFTFAETEKLKGKIMDIVLAIDTDTGYVSEVSFEIWNDHQAFTSMPAEMFLRIENALKTYRFDLTPAGKKLNYGMYFWGHRVGGMIEPLPPPVHPNERQPSGVSFSTNTSNYGGKTYRKDVIGKWTVMYDDSSKSFMYSPRRRSDGTPLPSAVTEKSCIAEEAGMVLLIKGLIDDNLSAAGLMGSIGQTLYLSVFINPATGRVAEIAYSFDAPTGSFPDLCGVIDQKIKDNCYFKITGKGLEGNYYLFVVKHTIGQYYDPNNPLFPDPPRGGHKPPIKTGG